MRIALRFGVIRRPARHAYANTLIQAAAALNAGR